MMKLLKKISTLLVSVCVVFGATAFAANSIEFSTPTYDGSADTISFDVSVAEAVTSVGADGYITLYFSEDDYSFASADCATNVYVDTYSDSIELAFVDDIDTSSDKVLATITLNVTGDKSAVVGTEFETDYIMYVPSREKVSGGIAFTVAAAAGEDKTEATIGTNGDVTFDYADGDSASSALAGKRVVLDSENKVSGNVKGKKVAVTYTAEGADPIVKTFGETLDKLLGLDTDGGDVEATVRFGIVCDPLLTGTFTFDIVE